jgi:hypothetical protein
LKRLKEDYNHNVQNHSEQLQKINESMFEFFSLKKTLINTDQLVIASSVNEMSLIQNELFAKKHRENEKVEFNRKMASKLKMNFDLEELQEKFNKHQELFANGPNGEGFEVKPSMNILVDRIEQKRALELRKMEREHEISELSHKNWLLEEKINVDTRDIDDQEDTRSRELQTSGVQDTRTRKSVADREAERGESSEHAFERE